MTKAALEAIVNALLAPSQPITANGMHKPSMQAVIDEMYDAQSRGDVLSGVDDVVSLAVGDKVLVIRSGEAKLLPTSVFSNGYVGDWDPTGDVLPTGTSRFKGQRWKLSADYKGWKGVIEARQDNPTTEAHFNFYSLTSF